MKKRLVDDFAKFALMSDQDALDILSFNNKLYYQFVLEKNGKKRVVKTPATYARLVQYYLIERVFSKIKTHHASVAYSRGASCLKNANYHKLKKYCFRFDLKNFFPSIKSEKALVELEKKIKGLKKSKDIEEELLDDYLILIEKYCFDSQKSLPLGFCSSPIISNILMSKFDNDLLLNLKSIDRGVLYTRYADDLIVSFDNKDNYEKLKTAIRKAVRDYAIIPLRLNDEKTRFGDRKFGSFFVNGLKITDDKRITLHRNYKDKIRSLVHKYKQKDPAIILKKESIKGHLNYAKHIDPLFYNKIFRNNFETIILIMA